MIELPAKCWAEVAASHFDRWFVGTSLFGAYFALFNVRVLYLLLRMHLLLSTEFSMKQEVSRTRAAADGTVLRALSNSAVSDDTFLTRKQLARLLNVASHTIACWDMEGRFPSLKRYRFGKSVRYHLGNVRRWVEEQAGATE